MKALIFNSGLGSRLGELTAGRPKSMVGLGSGETIFHRQLRILHACGIRDFVVTTGPFPEQLEAEAEPFRQAGCSFAFVNNPVYDSTNYIYSMWLAREELGGGDCLVLHGDLVFDAAYAQMVLDSELPSLGSVNASLPLPEKDFKARVVGGQVREVSVKIFDEDCVAFQPFYKLSGSTLDIWLDAVGRFVDDGQTGVYAENAANTVFAAMGVTAFSYEGHFVEEVDTPEDLERVSQAIRLYDFAQQPVFLLGDGGAADGGPISLVSGSAVGRLRQASDVPSMLEAFGMNRPLVVSASFFPNLRIAAQLDAAGVDYATFTGFQPNPSHQDVECALDAYHREGCDSLLSVGGGSAIDVAKCVKQLLGMPDGSDGHVLASSELPYAEVPHVAVPTTAGTGSESTHFAVCYVDGKKVSVASDCLQPDAVVLDASNLAGLPDHQKKCTMLDALCQAIESYWSVRSSEQSREHSVAAVPAIMGHAEAYLAGDPGAAEAVLMAANQAGKAINLTTTTAPHAMSYKITSLYGIPHGHAVAMCMPSCWRLLLERAQGDLKKRLVEIDMLVAGTADAPFGSGFDAFEELYASLDMPPAPEATEDELDELVASVNLQRLSNFPIELSEDDIRAIYTQMLRA